MTMLGKHFTEESKRKMSESHKGIKLSEERKRNMSLAHSGEKNHFYGKHHTLEVREKISRLKKGIKPPEFTKAHCENISKGRKGIKFSKNHCKMISDRMKGNIPWNKGKKLPHLSGKNHPCWQGGKTSWAMKIRNSLEMKLWRKAVFERDNYTCVWCGLKSGNGKAVILNADHIKPFALFPELHFAIDNGRTLCYDCHKKTDSFAGKTKLHRKTI